MTQALRLVSYRLRVTMGRRLGGYVGVVVLVGLVGGIAMASTAAARRTQSAFPAFVAGTNPSDLTVSTYGVGFDSAATLYSAATTAKIARLPLVRHVESWTGVLTAPLQPNGIPNFSAALNAAGSIDGLYFDQDRATPVQGRMADPARADEFVTTALGARTLGVHVGQLVPFGAFSFADAGQPGFGTTAVPTSKRVELRLVGIVVFNNEVVEDETDRLPTNIVFTPAFTRPLVAAGNTQGTWYGLQLTHGARDVPEAERELIGVFPKGSVYSFRVASLAQAKVERAIKPEAIALGVFGAIAALAALAVTMQSVSRQLWEGAEDREVLRALGAGPGAVAADGVIGVLAAVALGGLLACATAFALSPIAPLGPVRSVYRSGGLSLDWTVLGLGFVVLVGVIGSTAVLVAWRRAPRGTTGDRASRSTIARAVTSAGLPPAATVGVRFALEPGRGRTAVPVRSALCGAALAVVMVVTTLTFGSGLRTLVSSPSLYGWNWSYVLTSSNGIPPPAQNVLDHDPNVEAWSAYRDLNGQIDGQNVPILLTDGRAAVAPPVLAGHALEANGQAVLGAATIALLHKHVGDRIVVSYGKPEEAPFYVPPTSLVIVGTATLPALAGSATLADHVSMGTGAVLPLGIAPAAFQAAATSPDPNLNGPPLVMVRLRPGLTAAAGLADVQRAATRANDVFASHPDTVGDTVSVLAVQRPAEIVNYRSTGAAPVVLAAGLAVGATVALGLTLVASVRRRRRDLALLKTLGFTRRQLAATVAWQASLVALVGVVVGVPLGVAAGRWLWTRFAGEIYAVPRPTVPLSVAFVAAGTLVLVNVVAAIPGRLAARTSAALALRAE